MFTYMRPLRLAIALIAMLPLLQAAPAQAKPARASYKGIQVGATKRAVMKARRLKCTPEHHHARWCVAQTEGREKNLIIWMFRGRVSSINVNWEPSVQLPHSRFIQAYRDRYGAPNKTTTIEKLGQHAGEFLNVSWWGLAKDKVLIFSSQGSRHARSSGDFSLYLLDVRTGDALSEAKDHWLEAGLPFPPSGS